MLVTRQQGRDIQLDVGELKTEFHFCVDKVVLFFYSNANRFQESRVMCMMWGMAEDTHLLCLIGQHTLRKPSDVSYKRCYSEAQRLFDHVQTLTRIWFLIHSSCCPVQEGTYEDLSLNISGTPLQFVSLQH